MYFLFVLIILLTAIPGIRSTVKLAREPKDQRSTAAVWGLAAITAFSTALLLVAHYFDLIS